MLNGVLNVGQYKYITEIRKINYLLVENRLTSWNSPFLLKQLSLETQPVLFWGVKCFVVT